jgi:CspA family cold shock protein
MVFSDKVTRCVSRGPELISRVERQRALETQGEPEEPDLCADFAATSGNDQAGVSTLTSHVKWLSIRRGHGFITRDDGDADVFVHQSGIQGEESKAVFEGHKVGFEITIETRGPRAINVVP